MQRSKTVKASDAAIVLLWCCSLKKWATGGWSYGGKHQVWICGFFSGFTRSYELPWILITQKELLKNGSFQDIDVWVTNLNWARPRIFMRIIDLLQSYYRHITSLTTNYVFLRLYYKLYALQIMQTRTC